MPTFALSNPCPLKEQQVPTDLGKGQGTDAGASVDLVQSQQCHVGPWPPRARGNVGI